MAAPRSQSDKLLPSRDLGANWRRIRATKSRSPNCSNRVRQASSSLHIQRQIHRDVSQLVSLLVNRGTQTNLNVGDLAVLNVNFPSLLTSSKGTTQACLFRDNYSPITAAGLSVYGLSTDSPKSNTTFATKQSLPFPLLCDPSATL